MLWNNLQCLVKQSTPVIICIKHSTYSSVPFVLQNGYNIHNEANIVKMHWGTKTHKYAAGFFQFLSTESIRKAVLYPGL